MAPHYPAETHCGHGKLYTQPCVDCERYWIDTVTFPNAQSAIKKLRKFYPDAELKRMLFHD